MRSNLTLSILLLSLAAVHAPAARAQTPVRDPGSPGYVQATALPDGTNAPATRDGNFILGPTHPPAPAMSVHPDVPHGKIYEFTLSSADSSLYPGIARTPHTFGTPDPHDPARLNVTSSHPAPYTRRVAVYVPAQYVAGTPLPFIVGADGPDPRLFTALDNLIAAHRVPAMAAISIANGSGDAQGSERGLEYDTMSGRYAEFVEQEVLPRAESEAHVTLTHDPDGRATMGGSSGGSAALAMAWFHPELYHRVLTYSGTYVNQQWPSNPASPHGAAEFYEHLIPSSPRKPLRLWMEVGDRDLYNPNVLRDNLHDWVAANEAMARVLAAKHYPYQFVFARNAGHVDSAVVSQTLPEALEYIWQGYPAPGAGNGAGNGRETGAANQAATDRAWMLGPCTRASNTPILSPNPAMFLNPVNGEQVHWEALHTFNPAAIVRNGKVDVLYRAEDSTGPMQIGMHTSRLGLAESADGVHFSSRPTPVFYPAKDDQQAREWPGGTEDPRVIESADGTYVLTYTQWNRATYTVGIATSRDLIHWTKHGPAFDAAAGGKYRHLQYKSAGILTRLDGDHLVAAKIDGKYWMYWGEIQIRLATSPDLIHWTPVAGADGQPIVLLAARPGLFDSAFPEVGPPPLLTKKGIILLYNGKNADHDGAPGLSPGAYSGGQALFSADDPKRLLDRPIQPYLHPELPFEKTGQYKAGTIFTEGLVAFHSQWFLYYGAADSFVGVATCHR